MPQADAAYRLFTELVAYTPGLDDQHVVGHIFVDYQSRFALDRHAHMLQSMHGDTTDHDVRPAQSASAPVGSTSRASPPVVRNVLTNSSPVVLHFNGGAKQRFGRYRDHLLSQMSCEQLRQYVRAEIRTPKGALPYRTVCPASRFSLPDRWRGCAL